MSQDQIVSDIVGGERVQGFFTSGCCSSLRLEKQVRCRFCGGRYCCRLEVETLNRSHKDESSNYAIL